MTSDELADLIAKSAVILRSNPADYVEYTELARLVSAMNEVIFSGTIDGEAPAPDYDLHLWRALAISNIDDTAYCFKSMSLSNDELCMGMLVSFAALTLVLQSDGARAMSRRTATQLWTSSIDVAHDVPVELYTVAELRDALLVLRKEATTCVFCNEINDYMGALAHRSAELVLRQWPIEVHTRTDLRTEVSPGVYECSQQMITLVWTTLSAMYRRILHVTSTPMQCQVVEKPDATELSKLTVLKKLLLDNVQQLKLFQTAYIVRALYPETQLRPGDIESVRSTSQEIMPHALGIVKATSEPARMQKIAGACESQLGTMLLAELPPLQPGTPEPVLLGLCLCELMEVLSNNCGRASFSTAFAVTEPEIFRDNASLVATVAATEDRPVMLQIFNHWQLAYKSKLYMYNSFLRALLHWLHIAWSEYSSDSEARRRDHIGLAFLLPRSIYRELVAQLVTR